MMILDSAGKVQHSLQPPCSCLACLRATVTADQRRAELAEILARLDQADELVTEGLE